VDQILTICSFQWKLYLRNRRIVLFILGYPVLWAILAHDRQLFVLTLAMSPFFLRSLKNEADPANLSKPLLRHVARTIAMLPIFLLQLALYAGTVMLFREGVVPTVQWVVFALAVAMIVTLLTGVFADP